MKELSRQIPNIVRFEIECLKGSLEIENLRRNIGQGEMRQIL